MLTWCGIMLDAVDTPYRDGVLCLHGGALCSASVWRIHHSSAYRFASVMRAQFLFCLPDYVLHRRPEVALNGDKSLQPT